MMYFFAIKTTPNMIRLTVKKYHNQETTEIFFKVPGVLFCSTFEDCLNADWLVY